MRWLQKVLANQLSVRHHGWTLPCLAVTATPCLPPTSSTSLPGVIASALVVAHCHCTSGGRSRGLLPQPAQSPAQTKLPSSASPLVSPVLGQTALEEGYSRHGAGKALKIAAVPSHTARLSEPVTCIQSQDGAFRYRSSGFSLMLFIKVCL